MYVVPKVICQFPSETTQFADQVRIRLISQLTTDISKVLQKLLNYFNNTAIFASVIPALLVLSQNFDLNLNDSKSPILSFGSTLQYCHKLPHVFE